MREREREREKCVLERSRRSEDWSVTILTEFRWAKGSVWILEYQIRRVLVVLLFRIFRLINK